MSANDDEDIAPYEGWTFATAEDGDLRMTEMNRLAVAHDARAVRQDLKVSLGSSKGEDPLDREFGLDVFRATRSIPHLKREIRRTILYDDKAHDRVVAVPNITVDLVGHRHAFVYIEAELDTGDLQTFGFTIGGVI